MGCVITIYQFGWSVPMQTQMTISHLCMVFIPSHNDSYQIQVLSPGKSTYSFISRNRRPACCHQPYPPTRCGCRIGWSGLLPAALSCAERVHLGTSISMRKLNIGIQITVLFSPARKWLKVRGCYHRTMILRIVHCGRNVFRIRAMFSKSRRRLFHHGMETWLPATALQHGPKNQSIQTAWKYT